MANLLSEYTFAELRAELDARSAAQKASAATAPILNRNLSEVPTNDIVAAFRISQKGIYGVDDRKDIWQVTNAKVLRNADGVVGLFKSKQISNNGDGTSTLVLENFGKRYQLCKSEQFYSQPIGPSCTGFLVAPDIVATAGHCINERSLANIRFVFGFRMLDAKTATTAVKNVDIYSGTTIIGHELTDDGTDWCLVRLDRASSRSPLNLSRHAKIEDGAGVYVIGHPCGLPAKFADGANVRSNIDTAFFVANLDTYGGNSGSPVFNTSTHEVEGILVRGDTDFVPLGSCQVSAVCPTTGCGGESCTRVSEFLSKIP